MTHYRIFGLPSRRAKELATVRLSLRQTEARLHTLMTSDPYQVAFHDGVTVGLRQLRRWLADSRAQAQRTITDLGDHGNPDWKRGHDFAAAWIDEAIRKIGDEIQGRDRVEVATRHPQNTRPAGAAPAGAGRPGVPAGAARREPEGA